MSSTNKTSALGLSQWVLSDPFRMEDFNADNAKIDAAVAAVPYVKLLNVTTNAAATQVDLDVSAIRFSNYSKVMVYVATTLTPFATAENVLLRLNNRGATELSLTGGASYSRDYISRAHAAAYASFPQEHFEACISGLLGRPADKGAVLRIKGSGQVYRPEGGCEELIMAYTLSSNEAIASFNVLTNNSGVKIAAGSKFVIYGVKM